MKSLVVGMLGLVACGGNGSGGTDAGSSDAGSADAAPPPTGLVEFSAREDDGPRPGLDVYFLNADGTLAAHAKTDAEGKASAMMQAHGSVTAVSESTGIVAIATFGDVVPGDQLVWGTPPGGTAFELVIDVPADAAATSYSAFSPCGSFDLFVSSGRATGRVTSTTCAPPFDIVVVSEDSEYQTVHSMVATGVAAVSGTPVVLDEAWATPPTKSFSLANLPSDTTKVDLLLAFMADGYGTFGAFDLPVSNHAAMLTVGVPEVNATLIERVRIARDARHETRIVWSPAGSAPTQLDLASDLLPDFATEPAFDAATRRLVWTETPRGPARPDISLGMVAVDASPKPYLWSVLAPYREGVIQFPAVPFEGTDYPLPAGATEFGEAFMAAAPGGYAAHHEQLTSDRYSTWLRGDSGVAHIIEHEGN